MCSAWSKNPINTDIEMKHVGVTLLRKIQQVRGIYHAWTGYGLWEWNPSLDQRSGALWAFLRCSWDPNKVLAQWLESTGLPKGSQALGSSHSSSVGVGEWIGWDVRGGGEERPPESGRAGDPTRQSWGSAPACVCCTNLNLLLPHCQVLVSLKLFLILKNDY